MVGKFLHGTERFGNKMQRQKGISAESEGRLIRELGPLEGKQKEERDAEARPAGWLPDFCKDPLVPFTNRCGKWGVMRRSGRVGAPTIPTRS